MNPAFDTRILLLLYTLLPGLAGLRLVKVSIPAYKLRGESAFLECQYELNRPAHYLPNNNHNNNNDHDNININSNTNNNRRHQHPHGDLNYVDTDADADAADSDADELPIFGRSRSRARGQGQGQGPGPSQSHLRAYPYNQQQQQRHYDPDDGVFYPSQQQQQGRSYAFEDSRRRDAYHEELAGGGRRFGDDASDSQELEDGGEALYAVKWYKDNEEFYRYVPKAHPPKQSYRIDGIRVIEEHSDSSRVLLRGLTLNSTGLYRCEVSAEAPNFSSVQGEGRMDIVYLPRDGPHIKGQQFQYQIGELLNLNCTSGKSHPASHLQWFINDQPVMDTRFLMRYNDTVHKHGLITSTLGLQLTVDGRHFLNGAMRVKCMASISPVLWRGGKESVLQRRPGIIDNREAMLLVRSSTSGLHARRPQRAVAALLLALALVLRHQLSQLSPSTALGAIARTLGSGAIR